MFGPCRSQSRGAHLGNDIVDLTAPDARGKAADHRFVRRVCNEREQAWLDRQSDPTRALWRLFAAKEATYKATKKRWPERAVGLRHIVVSAEHGWAEVHGCHAALAFEETNQYIHCVAWLGQMGWAHCEPLMQEVVWARSETADARGVTDVSLRLRQIICQRLARRGLGAVEIRRDPGPERWRPPRIYASNTLCPELEVSLSHDGQFGAVVVGRSLLGQ